MGAQLAWGDEREIGQALAAISRAAADAGRKPPAGDDQGDDDTPVSDPE